MVPLAALLVHLQPPPHRCHLVRLCSSLSLSLCVSVSPFLSILRSLSFSLPLRPAALLLLQSRLCISRLDFVEGRYPSKRRERDAAGCWWDGAERAPSRSPFIPVTRSRSRERRRATNYKLHVLAVYLHDRCQPVLCFICIGRSDAGVFHRSSPFLSFLFFFIPPPPPTPPPLFVSFVRLCLAVLFFFPSRASFLSLAISRYFFFISLFSLSLCCSLFLSHRFSHSPLNLFLRFLP